MKTSIVFWFYKELDICENRLLLIKKHNPDALIYGLFGGKVSEASLYQERLGKYLDDFYTFKEDKDADWKWIHGDLVLLDWFDKRGRNLPWQTVAVVQWDMLVFDSIESQLDGMKQGETFFSGLRDLSKDIESVWHWTGGAKRNNYLNFLEYVKDRYGYTDNPALCCLYIFVVLPRIFFEKYLEVENKEIGMLEYKDPIYAKIFDIPFFTKDLGVLWHDNEGQKPLNAIPEEIPVDYIQDELQKENGYRLFHPYFKTWE